LPQLCLLRHAKSAWDAPLSGDHERPLAPRGRDAAPRIGQEMRRRGLSPDLVLCSTATRARETLELVLKSLGSTPEIRFDRRIYDAGTHELIDLISEFGTEVSQLLVVGHNPAMQITASVLSQTGDEEALLRLETKFPSAGLAILAFGDENWTKADLADGRLEAFVTPRSLTT